MRPFNVSSLALSPQRLFLRRLQRLLLLGLLITTLLLGGSLGTFALPVAQSQAYCEDLLVNPGFETRSGWELVGVESPPQYTTDRVYRGQWSMRLGIVGATNLPSISAVQQTIQIPTFATSLSLFMRYWPINGSNAGNDLQYVDIYNAYNNQFIKRIWSATTSITILDIDGDGDTDEVDAAIQEWPFLGSDLNDIKGMTDRIRIFFAVTNDGGGGTTALYLDDVQVRACDSQPPATATPTATPTHTPTPTITPTPSVTVTPSPSPTASSTATAMATPSITPTPLPTVIQTATPTFTPRPPIEGCVEVMLNGGFEGNGDWTFGQDPYPPGYDTGERFSGGRSVRLGVPSNADTPNVPTYSSLRQLISIPSTAVSADLRYRLKFRTDQAPDENPSNVNDRQELILLNSDLSTLGIVERRLRNTNSWEPLQEHSLLNYRGFPPFFIYFNVYNDGNGARTWAYLDDVSLCVTYAATPTATISPTPAATPTATPSATTPVDMTALTLATAVAAADAASDLLNQANALATLAAGTPTLDPNVQSVGEENIGGNRPVTPMGQTPTSMIPVSDRRGLTFGNLIGGAIFIILVIVVVAVLSARNQGPRRP